MGLSAIIKFIDGTLRETDGTPSAKRLLFAFAVVYSLGLVTAHAALARGLDAQAVDLAKTVVWATAGAYGVARFAENNTPPPAH